MLDNKFTPVKIDSTPAKPAKASSHQKPTKKDSTPKSSKVEQKKTANDEKNMPPKRKSVSPKDKEASDYSSEEIVEPRRSVRRLTRSQRLNQEDKEETYRQQLQQLQSIKQSKRKVTKDITNPLEQTNAKEAQTEIVRQNNIEFEDVNQKDNHSDDDEEV